MIERRAEPLVTATEKPITTMGTRKVRIWDIWVRLFHWSLAAAVLFSLFSGLSGVGFTLWHQRVGEIVLLLLIYRYILLFVGSSNTRLSALIQSPAAAVEHLKHLFARTLTPERGHNAAGAWAVLALLLLLGFQAFSGMFIADDPDFPLVAGAWFGSLPEDTMRTLKTLHEINAKLLIALVTLHIGMVVVYGVYAGMNLVRPMITGYRAWSSESTIPEVRFLPVGIGLVLALVIGVGGGWLLGWF